MNNDYQTPFSAEEIDEQIDFATQRLRSKPASAMPIPDLRLIEDIQRAYPADDEEMARALERVRRQLAQSAPDVGEGQSGQRRGHARRPDQGYSLESLPPRMPPGGRQRRSFPARLVALAAAVLLVAVIGGLVAGIILVRQHSPVVSNQPTTQPGQTAQPTQPPTPQEIAYIGSDNNVWVMTWPGGTPKQLTNDAQGSAAYSSPVWSPDGSLLAVAKGASTHNGSMVIMKPDGTVVVNVPLPALNPYDIPFAWSPDSTMLAFRGEVTSIDPTNFIGTREILLLDAHTGKTVNNTLTYQVGGVSGCGGGGPTSDLMVAIWQADHFSIYEPEDAFDWSPDGHSLLFTRTALGTCSRGQGIEVDLSTGATNAPYPLVGSYQPGGNLILGYWSDGTLGLTDLSANHVRALVKPESSANPPQYMVTLGRAAWANDGQTVYYEHNDSIWQIGADASNPHQVIAGTAFDSQDNATVQLLPRPSPDGHMLLYLQITGSGRSVDSGDPTPQPTPTIPLTSRWYVAQADGSNPMPLPQGVKEAVWRPGKRG